jgi:hypothetical protein
VWVSAPATPVTLRVYQPCFVSGVVCTARVAADDAGFGVTSQLVALGRPVRLNPTSAAKPFSGVTFTVKSVLPPLTTDRLDGVTVRAKSGRATVVVVPLVEVVGVVVVVELVVVEVVEVVELGGAAPLRGP